MYRINGNVLGHTCIVKITDTDPRKKMFDLFGSQWCFEYDSLDDILYLSSAYPSGIFNVNENCFEKIR